MEEYYKVEWYVCKDIYIHKSIDIEALEDDETVYSKIRFRGYGLSLNDDDFEIELESFTIIEHSRIDRALEYAYDVVEGMMYPDEEELVEIFIDEIILEK